MRDRQEKTFFIPFSFEMSFAFFLFNTLIKVSVLLPLVCFHFYIISRIVFLLQMVQWIFSTFQYDSIIPVLPPKLYSYMKLLCIPNLYVNSIIFQLFPYASFYWIFHLFSIKFICHMYIKLFIQLYLSIANFFCFLIMLYDRSSY